MHLRINVSVSPRSNFKEMGDNPYLAVDRY